VTARQYVTGRGLFWAVLIGLSIVAAVLPLLGDPVTTTVVAIAAVILLINVFFIVKYPFYGLLLYLAVFLVRPGELFPVVSHLRVELLIGCVTLISIAVNQKLRRGVLFFPRDRVTLSLAAFQAAILLSIFTSYEKTQTFEHFIMFLKVLVFYYLIVTLVTSKRRFMVFVSMFLLLIAYMASSSMYSYLAGQFTHTMNVDRLTGTSSSGGDPNTLATTLVSTIPLIVASALCYRRKLFKVGLLILSLSLIALVVITASRGGLLALLGAIIGGVALSRRKVLVAAMAILLAIIAWYAMPHQYQARYERFSEISTDVNQASSGRWEIWAAGLQMITAHPIIGIGAGAFPWAYSSGDYGHPQFMKSHNVYIQVAATTGLAGLSIWAFFLVSVLGVLNRVAAQARDRPGLRWAFLYRNGVMVVLIALGVAGMFGHSLYRYTWYMAGALAVSLTNILATTGELQVDEDMGRADRKLPADSAA